MTFKPSVTPLAFMVLLGPVFQLVAGVVLLEVPPAPLLMNAIIEEVGEEHRPDVVAIMGDHWLAAYCLIGSALGAILSIAIFPIHNPKPVGKKPRQSTPSEPEVSRNLIRQLCVKFAASLICGVLAAPVTIRYYDFPRDVDFVLFISGAIAFLSISAIHAGMPFLLAGVASRVKSTISVTGLDPVPPEQNQDHPGNSC